MNQNDFDNNSSGQSPFDGYEVYSKQYTPGDNGYTEQKQYSKRKAKATRDANRRILAVVCVTLAVLFVCMTAFFVSMKIAFSYYEAQFDQQEETEVPETQAPEESGPSQTETDTKKDKFFFSSGEDTDIKLSDTSGEPLDATE